MKKSITVPYTNGEQSKHEIKETISLKVITTTKRYLGINLTKEVQKLYSENYKISLKEKDPNNY